MIDGQVTYQLITAESKQIHPYASKYYNKSLRIGRSSMKNKIRICLDYLLKFYKQSQKHYISQLTYLFYKNLQASLTHIFFYQLLRIHFFFTLAAYFGLLQIQMSLASALIFSVFLVVCHSASYNYSPCDISHYLNTANMQCVSCSSNHIANTYQSVPTSCQCSNGYKQSTDGLCTPIIPSITCNTARNFYPLYNLEGDNVSASNCTLCNTSAYANSNSTGCVPCGSGMTYTTQGCTCSNGNLYSELGCFISSYNPSPTGTFANQLKYLIPGCGSFKDYLSCSQMVNLCSFSMGNMANPQCSFFPTNSLTSYLYSDGSSFSLTVTKSSTLSIKLITYLYTGNYVGEKVLLLSDLMRCGVPSNTQVNFAFGTNIRNSCVFDFNNLILQMQGRKYVGKTYQLLVMGDNGVYSQVPVYMPGSTQPIKRFFLQDTYSNPTQMNVLNSFTLSFTLSTDGHLTLPSFTPSYTLFSTSLGVGIIPSGSSSITLNYQILFLSNLSNYWVGALASFITISVLALIHAIIKTYIGYLNKKSALTFLLNFTGTYSLWLFYYLLVMTGYWFLFTKTTSSPFILLPSHSTQLYGAFYALVGVMVFFRLVWVVADKSQKLSTEVFLINWERNQFKNSWRQIFIVNSLAEFYTHRTVSLFWMLAIVMFFMNGVGWEKSTAQTISTSQTYKTLTPINRLLLYFVASAVFLAVGFIFKILRRLSVIFWPYPFEDFADYCTVTNISFLFVKRRAPHAYYLHASLPDRTEVTYKEINEAIRRGLQKNRTVMSELPSIDSIKMYSLYLSKDIEQKHSQMLKRLEDQEHSKRIKYTKQSSKKKQALNLREDFIQTRLKPHLEGMASRENNERRKSLLQNLCGTPPIDLRENHARNKSEVFYDDQLQLVNEVFPNGNEFQEIHTLIVIFLGFVTLVNSCPIAAFLTYFVDQCVFKWWIQYSCRVGLEEMTRVKRGFML